jgi:hypothetical protein
MICIDFQGGAHGNYLEFVCNKIIGVTNGTPFNSLGSSHNKQYTGEKMFYARHYSFWPSPFLSDKIISIQIDIDDLLPLQQVSLLRAGDYDYDNDQLEIDTYNKLNNVHYRWVLDMLIDGFFKNQIQNSYDAVKDPSWPNVTTIAEFENLPNIIKQECIEQHNLVLLNLSSSHPDCPRSVLREFFQIGFQHPRQHGFIARQEQVKYDKSKQMYMFPFRCFYNKLDFLEEIKKIAEWSEIQYTCQQEINQLHDEFLQKQPYKDSKVKCDEIVMQIKNNTITHSPTVDLLQEAYINAKLGWNYFS